jgi:hypothetical protein
MLSWQFEVLNIHQFHVGHNRQKEIQLIAQFGKTLSKVFVVYLVLFLGSKWVFSYPCSLNSTGNNDPYLCGHGSFAERENSST